MCPSADTLPRRRLAVPSPRPRCGSDGDCGRSETCHQGVCVDPCQLRPCGANAFCRPTNHKAFCVCELGYTGNAQIECVKREYPESSLPGGDTPTINPRITVPW